MTKETLNKLIAMYLIAVGEKGMPSSHLWLLADPEMKDVDLHNRLLGLMGTANLLKVKGHFVTLTEKGHAMREKVEGVYLAVARVSGKN